MKRIKKKAVVIVSIILILLIVGGIVGYKTYVYLNSDEYHLKELGYKVNFEELDKIEIVTKAHISQDIV